MIGLVLVSHGFLARDLAGAMIHVVGEQKNIEAVCIQPDDNMEEQRARIKKAIKKVEEGEGVLVLTDMLGGTPSNLAVPFLEKDKVEILSGMNLPLLIKLASVRETTPLIQAARLAKEAGQRYIALASDTLKPQET